MSYYNIKTSNNYSSTDMEIHKNYGYSLIKLFEDMQVPAFGFKKNCGVDTSEQFHGQKLFQNLESFQLSDNVKVFVKWYERSFSKDKMFFCKWVGTLLKESGITLSCIDKAYLNSVTEIKILICLLSTIIFDIAEGYKDRRLLSLVLQLLRNNKTIKKICNNKIFIVKKIWDYISTEVSEYPRFIEFKDAFIFDFNQILNSAEYTYLINKHPECVNSLELEIHNDLGITVFLNNEIDLMISPKFELSDLSNLRKIFWYAQQMMRIDNCLLRWKKEINEKNYTSSTNTYSISDNIKCLSYSYKLEKNELIKKAEKSDIYYDLLHKWRSYYLEINSFKNDIKSVDLGLYLEGLKNVQKYHLLFGSYLNNVNHIQTKT